MRRRALLAAPAALLALRLPAAPVSADIGDAGLDPDRVAGRLAELRRVYWPASPDGGVYEVSWMADGEPVVTKVTGPGVNLSGGPDA